MQPDDGKRRVHSGEPVADSIRRGHRQVLPDLHNCENVFFAVRVLLQQHDGSSASTLQAVRFVFAFFMLQSIAN